MKLSEYTVTVVFLWTIFHETISELPEEIRLGYIAMPAVDPNYESTNAVFKLALERMTAAGIMREGAISIIPYLGKILCQGYIETLGFLDLVVNQSISGLIGPPCSSSGVPIGHLGTSYNMLMISYLTTSDIFADKSIYQTYARVTLSSASQIIAGVIHLLKMNNWNRVAVMTNPSSLTSRALSANVGEMLGRNGINMIINVEYDQTKPDFDGYLKQLNDSARIILMMISWDHRSSSNLMIAAQKANMTGPEYVWIQPLLNPVPASDWETRSPESRQSFRATIMIALEAYDEEKTGDFDAEVERKFFEIYGNDTEFANTYFHTPIYDALYAYAMVLNLSVEAGVDYRNGTGLFDLLKWKRFENGATSPIIFNGKSERMLTLLVKSLDENYKWEQNMLFDRILNSSTGLFDFATKVTKSAIWLEYPALDTPICGFQGELCVTTDNLTSSTGIYISVAVAVIFIFLSMLVSFVFYKRQQETIIMSQSWKLDASKYKETVIRNFGSQKTIDDRMTTVSSLVGNGSITTAIYDINPVYAIKYSKSKNLNNFNRSELISLRKYTHISNTNVTKFVGIVVEDVEMIFVWQLNHVRTLRDTLQKTDITLDNDFLASFMKGVLQGLKYLHGSSIGWHGWLTSDTTLVDSRFVVRLSQFGLTQILHPLINAKQVTQIEYHRNDYFHMAPEILSNFQKDKTHPGSVNGDIYSLSMLFYQIITQNELYQDSMRPLDELLYVIINTRMRPCLTPNELGEWSTMGQMIRDCWEEDVRRRPNLLIIESVVNETTKKYSGNLIEKMIHRMERYTNNLEKVVAERTVEVQVEKEKAEGLLQQMLPKLVVERLQAGKTVEPESFMESTILFTDIVNFTVISSQKPVFEIVSLLNNLFGSFDEMIDKRDAYKVETIGDAYMVVSGVPQRTEHHAREICLLALDMRDLLFSFVPPFQIFPGEETPRMQIRLGVHSGAVAAGVVGMKMPRYCLFGDTVNTASRMESSGVAMQIHCSTETRNILETSYPQFQVTIRGDIEIKGKGIMTTYFVEREQELNFLGVPGFIEHKQVASGKSTGGIKFPAKARPDMTSSRKRERGQTNVDNGMVECTERLLDIHV